MAMETGPASFANKLGARVAQANEEHKSAPIDVGRQRLPAGIVNGVAKLQVMTTKEETNDGKACPKGQVYFQATAAVMSPLEHAGCRVEGLQTNLFISLCDVPAKGQSKAKTLSQNWFKFQNLFKLLSNGALVCHETNPEKIQAFYFAAMKTLTDPARPPVYISFSTRGWTPPATVANPKPDEYVTEEWHGLAKWDGKHNPAASVTVVRTQPEPFQEPPRGVVQGGTTSAPPTQTVTQTDDGPIDPADIVAGLVEVAMSDPLGATADGQMAGARLEELAWEAGWTKEQTKLADDWAAVGEMVLNAPPIDESAQEGMPNFPPTVGSKWKFAKRDSAGNKLRNVNKVEFAPQEVEITSVDFANKVCTVKTTRDGKDVVDIKSKEPVAVKFEWLE